MGDARNAASLSEWVPDSYKIVRPSTQELRAALRRYIREMYGDEMGVDEFLSRYRNPDGLEDHPAFRFLAHMADLLADAVEA